MEINYIAELWSQILDLFSGVDVWLHIKVFFQVLIIGWILFWLWRRIVGSQAERLVKGVLVLAGIWAICLAFGFTLITSLLQLLVPVALIALVVIFQPELRRGLSHLGKVQTLRFDLSLTDADKVRFSRDVDQIINAVRELSRSKTGALIVIEPLLGERDYVSPGTTVNADISTTLLLTIFFPNSPLHDGAVVIRKNKIVAAGVILPMTDDPELSYRYGTRHRAAIGLSETYDGLCIVVSEETGAISAASRGMLARYKAAEDLKDPIRYLYTQGGDSKSRSTVDSFLSLFSRGRKEETLPALSPPGRESDSGKLERVAPLEAKSPADSSPKTEPESLSEPVSEPKPEPEPEASTDTTDGEDESSVSTLSAAKTD